MATTAKELDDACPFDGLVCAFEMVVVLIAFIIWGVLGLIFTLLNHILGVMAYVYYWIKTSIFGIPPRTEQHLGYWRWWCWWSGESVEITLEDKVYENDTMLVRITERKLILYRDGVLRAEHVSATNRNPGQPASIEWSEEN